MANNDFIKQKIEQWIWYEENSPKTDYFSEPKVHDDFRKKHDLDCVLTGGNLYADTIFSLWTPLRFAFVRLNGYEKLQAFGKINSTEERMDFLKNILKCNALDMLLPTNSEIVIELEKLFELGQRRCNVMILPERWLQKRSSPPYYDYMPHFLYECFEGGKFSKAFQSDSILKNWIKEEALQFFFYDDRIQRNNIRDLSGMGQIENNVPDDLTLLLDNYISILNKRNEALNISNS